MNVITLKIPEALHLALQAAGRQRGMSKSAVVREALERSLLQHERQSGMAARWAEQWRGALSPAPQRARGKAGPDARDARLKHLMSKHVV